LKEVVELSCPHDVNPITENSRGTEPNVTQFTGHAAVQQNDKYA